MRNSIFFMFSTMLCMVGACSSPSERFEALPSAEQLARVSELADYARKMDSAAANDPTYAGNFIDEAADRVVVQFNDNASEKLARLSDNVLYTARNVSYSLAELEALEPVVTAALNEGRFTFRTAGTDIRANRVRVTGLSSDERDRIERTVLGADPRIELFFRP